MQTDTPDAEGTRWCEEIDKISDNAKGALASLEDLTKWLWKNVIAHDVLPLEIPQDLRPILSRLTEALVNVGNLARSAHVRYDSEPYHKALNGRRLTREEYYVLAATGWGFGTNKHLGLSELDDFEAFSMLCFEGGYINPLEIPREPQAKLIRRRYGVPPEEVRLDSLRQEQRDFFEKDLPEVFVRFRQG